MKAVTASPPVPAPAPVAMTGDRLATAEGRSPGSSSFRRRQRHPGDVIRLMLGAAILGGGAVAARRGLDRLEVDVFRLVNDLPSVFAPVLRGVMQLGAFGAVPAAAVVALAARRPRLARDIGVSGTVAYLLAKVVKALVARGRPAELLGGTILRGAADTGLGFPSGHAAVAAALATAAAPHLGRRARRVLWGLAALVALARVYVGAHLPVDVIGGAALGWMVGAGLHLAWGAPRSELSKAALLRALRAAGLPAARAATPALDARGSTPVLVEGDGRALFVKVVNREDRNADLLFKAWRWIAFRHVEDEAPFATPKQAVEHEAYLALLGARAGVATPGVLATVATPDGSALLVEERLAARSVDTLASGEVSDGLLADMWSQVARLREGRIAHRDLRLANLMVDSVNRVWLIDFGFAEAAAGQRRLDQDVAQLLVSCALVVGPARSVAAAAGALGGAALAGALPLLQPLALSAATRGSVRRRPGLLQDLRGQAAAVAGVEPPPAEPLTRVRPRAVATVAVLGFAVHLLLPQVGEIRHTLQALHGARWDWLAVALLASAASYPAAAVVRLGSVDVPLPLGLTTAVQLAGSFANRLTPGSLGGVGLNERYLERQGVERPAAVAGVAGVSAAGLAVHLAGLAVALTMVGRAGLPPVHLPRHWPVLVGVVAALGVTGLVVRSPLQRWLLPPLRDTTRALLRFGRALRRPTRAVQLLGGSAAVTASYVLALAACLHAFGAAPSIERVAAAFLGATALASAAPTPGGLGAVEAALVAALTGFGVATGPAVAGVLAFRLVTFWLPAVPGWFAFRSLRRQGVI